MHFSNNLDIANVTIIESIITTIAGDNGVSVDAGTLSTVTAIIKNAHDDIKAVNTSTDVSSTTLEEIQEYTKKTIESIYIC